MHMVRIVTQTPPTFTTENAEERHLLSHEVFRNKYALKEWSQNIKNARFRSFQRNVNSAPGHATKEVMFQAEGIERKRSNE